MAELRGVILDVDGTLVDSNDAHARAWQEALAEQDIQVPLEKIRSLIGMGGDKLLPRVSDLAEDSALGKKISERRGEIFASRYMPKLSAFPRAKELLERMHGDGLKLVVASSAKKKELTRLLDICGAQGLLDGQTSSDDADNSKPDPDIVQAALQDAGLMPQQALMLGDTPYDIQGAGRAGVKTIALRCGGWGDADLAQALAIYNDPSDLLARYSTSPLARTRG